MGNGISDYDKGEIFKILCRKCMTFALKIHYPSGDLAHPEPPPSPGGPRPLAKGVLPHLSFIS